MVKQLLEEVRPPPSTRPAGTGSARSTSSRSANWPRALSPDLAAELDRVSIPFDNPTPSDAELRVAQAQLVGWLEGLFHGIQATLVAQQVAARAQLDEMRQRSLPGDRPVGRPTGHLPLTRRRRPPGHKPVRSPPTRPVGNTPGPRPVALSSE